MITAAARKENLALLINEIEDLPSPGPIQTAVLHRLKLAVVGANSALHFFASDDFHFHMGQVMAHLEYLGHKDLWLNADFIRSGD